MGEIALKYNENRGEKYINAFPRFKKWINECICCHSKGYDPSMPSNIGGEQKNLGTYYIKKYFNPLSINKDGLCEQCAKINNNILEKND